VKATSTMPMGPRVLVVEDDALIRKVIVHHLRKKGYNVDAVGDAEDGYERAQNESYDLVLSDIHLPTMSGLELARHLAEAAPGLPVVLMTGDPDMALMHYTDQGPDILLKPFAFSELNEVLSGAMKRRA
jgi:DNA-binding response OmpR family regulator